MGKKIWVVEMLCGRAWMPTIGVGISRPNGYRALARWRAANPADRFRLRPYAEVDRG